MVVIKAEYLGDADVGVRVHSNFLTNCDAREVFGRLKKSAISKDNAPFFIDLYDSDTSTIIDTIGITEATYSEVTGEMVMSFEYYQREADYNQDLIFGALELGLREKGVDLPWLEKESHGLAAQKLQKARRSDHVFFEMNVDELELSSSPENH